MFLSGGQIAYSADADIVLWRTDGNGVMVSQYTNAFTAVSSLPATAVIASDKGELGLLRCGLCVLLPVYRRRQYILSQSRFGLLNLAIQDCCQPERHRRRLGFNG